MSVNCIWCRGRGLVCDPRITGWDVLSAACPYCEAGKLLNSMTGMPFPANPPEEPPPFRDTMTVSGS